jgi:aspartate carbamoyltransferase catalytic subunit
VNPAIGHEVAAGTAANGSTEVPTQPRAATPRTSATEAVARPEAGPGERGPASDVDTTDGATRPGTGSGDRGPASGVVAAGEGTRSQGAEASFRRLPNLISIEDLDAAQVRRILDTTEQLLPIAQRERNSVPTLRGKMVCNLFLEDSTRTRISFELAAKRLSAEVLNFSAKGSSVSKGESFKDTALTLDAMGVDCVVVRSGSSGAPLQLSRYLDVPILNAGDGWHQHPTQALLDVFTMRRHLGDMAGRRVVLVGDLLHSRVARSEVQALRLLGARVTVVAPPTLLPPAIEGWDVEVARDLDDVLPSADVVYALRVQRERMHGAFFPSVREYARRWGLDGRRLRLMRDDAIVMHPGPMNRGVEITGDVADSDRAVITEQVTNGIAVRMACLYLLLAGGAAGGSSGQETVSSGQQERESEGLPADTSASSAAQEVPR